MPLYLVRWPELRVSLIQAQDEEALMRSLDEVDDPSQCRWTEYQGALWIDLMVPATVVPKDHGEREPESLEECVLEGAGDLARRFNDGDPVLDAAVGPLDAEASSELQEQTLRWAFPALAQALYDREGDQPARPSDVQEALESESEALFAFNRDPEAFCADLEASRQDESDGGEAPRDELTVGEFTVDGQDYIALLDHGGGGEVSLARVVERKRLAGEPEEVRTEHLTDAQWEGDTRRLLPSETTSALGLTLLSAAEESLRAELARKAN